MRKLIARFLNWFRFIPGEDGLAEWADDTHDPQYVKRIMHDDDFPFERWRP